MPNSRVLGRRFLLSAAAAISLMVAPASASATTFVVNSFGPGFDKFFDNEVCETATPGECTLRTAIEESNADTDEDVIRFDEAIFDGADADVIPNTGIPALTKTVTIDGEKLAGGRCSVSGGERPCVGISATGGSVLTVNNADKVTIRGIAITGGGIGINVIDSSEEFRAFGNWIGVKLDGNNGGSGTGIFIDPDSDDAEIGAPSEPAQQNGNVISNQVTGLDIAGADGVTVQGNYFGTDPSGTTLASNTIDMEATGLGAYTTTDLQVGANVEEFDFEAVTTPACDGGCNVFAGRVSAGFVGAVDFRGEQVEGEIPVGESGDESAAVQGNYFGLDASGEPMPDAAQVGVLATGIEPSGGGETGLGPEKVLVGGGQPGETNNFAGGSYGVYASNAPSMIVGNNEFGLTPTGDALVDAPGEAVYVFTEAIPPGTNALITENTSAFGESGIGVTIQGAGANVIDNVIGLGTGGEELGAGGIGVYAWGNVGGSLIEGNTIFGASQYGVLLKSAGNGVEGNTILNSNQAGVLVEGGGLAVTGSSIGGEEPQLENEISGTDGPAIALAGSEVDQSYMFRNHGSDNDGPFIDLGFNGPGTAPGQPNGGIQSPTIDAVTATSASGTAKPEAAIRVFRKATAGEGEIESYVGGAETDGSGKWTVSFAALPGETNIAASQTTAGDGTSEYSFAVTPVDPPKGKPPVCPTGTSSCGPGGPFPSTPETRIAKKPKLKGKPTAKFKFTSSIAGSSFECKLDKKPFKPCSSPKTYKKLKPGKHTFKVRAVSPANVADLTPATKKFKVKR